MLNNGIRTGKEYLAGLRDDREIWTKGKRVKDVAKLVTTPFRAVLGIKSKQDAKEKFASEEVMAAGPTNNVGGGQIAGTVEAGDDPPVKKKRNAWNKGKKYMKGSRKQWMV